MSGESAPLISYWPFGGWRARQSAIPKDCGADWTRSRPSADTVSHHRHNNTSHVSRDEPMTASPSADLAEAIADGVRRAPDLDDLQLAVVTRSLPPVPETKDESE